MNLGNIIRLAVGSLLGLNLLFVIVNLYLRIYHRHMCPCLWMAKGWIVAVSFCVVIASTVLL